jgi:hypothetical protein
MRSDNFIGMSLLYCHPSSDISSTAADHAPFISPKFNVNAYANAILAGEPYDPEAQIPAPPVENEAGTTEDGDSGEIASGSLNVKGDVGLALAKLNYGVVSSMSVKFIQCRSCLCFAGRCDATIATDRGSRQVRIGEAVLIVLP